MKWTALVVEVLLAAPRVIKAWKRRRRKRRLEDEAKTPGQLDAIRTEAGTKAPWEVPLGEQTRRARLSALKRDE